MKKSSHHLLALIVGLFIIASCSIEDTAIDTESIWVINKMELKEDLNINQYYQSLQANWANPREEGLKNGLLLSYDIVPVPKEEGKWELLLLTQYSDADQLGDFKSNYPNLIESTNPQGIVLVDGKGPRDFANQVDAQILSNTEFKQLLSSVNTGV